jgi:arylsulfatase A-like enzyme
VSQGISRRRFLGAAGAGVAGAALGGIGLKELAAGAAERQNIVLIIIDSLRPDHLGCYGNREVRTPNLNALARESVRFTRVFPDAMPTVPARRSILTGRRAYPFRGWEPWSGLAKRPGWSPIMPGTPTMITALRHAGYWTGYVTDNPFLGYVSFFEPWRRTVGRLDIVDGQRKGVPGTGIPRSAALHYLPPPLRIERKINYIRYYLANNGRANHESRQAAARVFTRAGRVLGAAARQKPFCLVVDAFDPHEPWTPPRKYMDLYGDPDYRGQEVATLQYRPADYLTETQLRRLNVAYKAEVTMVDRWLGVFLNRLHDLNLERETAIVLLSDHGLFLGERNWTGKSDSLLHPELIQVPLMVRDQQGRGAGTTSDYFATTVDIPPTLFSMAGLRSPRFFEGADLSPIARGEAAEERRFAYGGYSSWTFIRDERWKLIVRNDKREYSLYDLDADPGERRNVARAHPDQVDRLWRAVLRKAGGRPPYYDRPAIDATPRTSF